MQLIADDGRDRCPIQRTGTGHERLYFEKNTIFRVASRRTRALHAVTIAPGATLLCVIGAGV